MSYKLIRKYNSNVHIYEFDPTEERISLELGIRGRLESVTRIGTPKSDEEVACRINAGFYNFDGSREHLGLLISNGLYYSPPSNNFIDVVLTNEYELYITQIAHKIAELNWLQANTIFACGSSFSLIQNSEINLENCGVFQHYLYRHPRTAVGQKCNGNIVFCVVAGRSSQNAGVTGGQLAKIMFDERCINAVNFDGGGSSVMTIGDTVVGGTVRPIGSVFVVYKKKASIANGNYTSFPTLRFNSRGFYVKTLQEKLINKGYNLGRWGADGHFGLITSAAVRQFQRDTSSRWIDGIVGQETWRNLFKGV